MTKSVMLEIVPSIYLIVLQHNIFAKYFVENVLKQILFAFFFFVFISLSFFFVNEPKRHTGLSARNNLCSCEIEALSK